MNIPIVERRGFTNLREPGLPVALALGDFSGVHIGNREVLRATRLAADGMGGLAWVLSLEPADAEAAPPPLLGEAQMRRALNRQRIDRWWILPETSGPGRLPLEEFVRRMKSALPSLFALRVEDGWDFGRGGRGARTALAAAAGHLGVECAFVQRPSWRGQPVTTALVREMVEQGDLDHAEDLLGHPVEFEGPLVMVEDEGLHMELPDILRPPDGVYAARVEQHGRWIPCAGYLPAGLAQMQIYPLEEEIEASPESVRLSLHRRLRPDPGAESLDIDLAEVQAALA